MQRSILMFSSLAIILSAFFITEIHGQWMQTSGINSNEITDNFAVIGNKIFVCDFSSAVYVSTNDGANWSISLNYPGTTSLAVNGNNIYAGVWQYGFFRSSNSGSNWEQVSTGNLFIDALDLNSSHIFAGMHLNIPNQNYLFRSSNNGTNWEQTPLNKYINCIKVNGNNIFAGTGSFGVYLSTNNGSNWIQTDLDSVSVYSIAVLGNLIFASASNYPAGKGGIYQTSNNGSSWARVFSYGNSYDYYVTAIGENLFAGCDIGAFVSTSGGEHWVLRNEGFSSPIPVPRSYVVSGNYLVTATSKSVWRRLLSEVIGLQQISLEVPSVYSLGQNYPNPFNPETKIKFQIKNAGIVTIKVFDVLGREVSEIIKSTLQPGTYEVPFDASNLSSGVYFYRLITENFSDTKKLVLVK